MESIDRRRFMQLALTAIGALSLPACQRGTQTWRNQQDTAVEEPDGSTPSTLKDVSEWTDKSELPGLGGAPDSVQGRVIAAFNDSIVPGRHRDPFDAPGAIDVGTPAMFFDTRLPAAPLVPLMVTVLNTAAAKVGGATFDKLTPQQREKAIEQALGDFPEMEFAVQLVKLAYFSSAEAGKHLGYPGANKGYVGDPDFSFNRAITKPHPQSIEGNFP